MEHGVLFEVDGIRKHSFADWGLFLSPFQISYPKPKTEYVEIEGGNGSIDLTDAYGEIYYKNREYSMTFECRDKVRFDETLNEIISFLHGKKAKITFYFDELWFQVARISVNQYTSSRAMGKITMNVVAEPYKYKQKETIESHTITNRRVLTYKNSRMPVVPTFTASTPMNFTFKGNSYAVGTNPTKFVNVIFREGDNIIEFTGDGIIEVRYQEGAL